MSNQHIFQKDIFIECCEQMLETYKEPYIANSKKSIEYKLEQYVIDVNICYKNKTGHQLANITNPNVDLTIIPYRNKLRDFLS